ncbi:hypothetical protein M422DRAFT_774766 [Sphaerobolus stellatus SS14]|nr:hypothetical protein M422DRAFT_774766 [Sphaerobolus stellatus SS14]
MSSSKVQVTFAAPLIFLSSDQWTQIRAAISAQFPLRDLVWKPSSRPAVRIIPELNVELVAFETIREELVSQIPQSLLEKPFLNLYVVTCDDTDTYKNSVRKQIKDWHATISQRKNQEWLILLVVRPDARATAGGFFKSTVLDRIKSDFNVDKRDRCVQLVWSQNAIAPQSLSELTVKLKDGIMSAFDSAVLQRSEEIKRSENQRTMPGWNFCTFFILKESLASSFVGMGIPDDAILTYSELEASFLQVQASSLGSQKAISWFGKLINPDPYDDSLPLLDVTKKPYRDLFLNNTISLFDFRVYLLAKHCEVLGLSGKLAEMARKTATFLGGFAQRLRDCDAPLPPYFIESWIFSSALNVVSESETYAAMTSLDTASSATFSAAKGELLELARTQLDKIGIKQGHLPQSAPFSMSLPPQTSDLSHPTSPTTPTGQQITNAALLTALTDQEAFDKLYVDTTNRAIEMYIKGGRRKFALRLHGSLAAFDLHRTRDSQAHQTYTSLPAHYTPHSWNTLATFMQARRLDTHARLGKPHDREWVETVLAFLKVFVKESMEADIGLGRPEDVRDYVKGLIEDMKKDSEAIEDGVIAQEHPMFSVGLNGEVAIHRGIQDGSYIDVTIRNLLPCTIDVDTIRLTLQGPDSIQLVFSSNSHALPPGSSSITLFCPNPAFGLFVLSTSEIAISNLVLKWDHKFHPNQSRYPITSQRSTLVRIPRDYGAVDVKVELPRKIQLDAPQSILLTLRSGRNDIISSTVKFPSSMGIEFQTANAEPIAHDEDVEIFCEETGIRISNMEKESQVRVRIPHSYHAGTEPLKVIIDLEYRSSATAGETQITRQGRFVRPITTALPLMIQAHDHFRSKSVISDFSISTSPGTYQHLRISHAKLECADDEEGGISIAGCRSARSGTATVTPNQPAHFLFQIASEAPRISYASMHLSIGYRLLREEIEVLLTAHISLVLNELLEPHYLLEEIKSHILKALENDAEWVSLYKATKELHVKRTALPELLETTDNALIKKVADMVIDSLHSNRPIEVEDLWHEVIVPVDLPFKNVVSAVSIRIHYPQTTKASTHAEDSSQPQSLYAGQPIAATLSIGSSFHWGGPSNQSLKDRSYGMRFDVKEVPNDWLISGRKKGDFLATDDGVYSVPLTLIPLHHGELRLPEVHVYPLPLANGEMTMGSMTLPSAEVYQSHGAEKVLILPRGGRTTFVVGMGS